MHDIELTATKTAEVISKHMDLSMCIPLEKDFTFFNSEMGY